MMSLEQKIQQTVHALEIGRLASWVRRAVVISAILALAVFYLLHEFRGLATREAMDQAQIGRELASGHGWSTKFLRPLGIGLLQRQHQDVTRAIWLDTYEAPLPPLVDALALLTVKAHWKMVPTDVFYAGDHALALLAVFFFLASVALLYCIACELFDPVLARFACGLVLVCDMMWRYSISGLPQMLMLFLFHGTIYALLRAMKAQYLGGRGRLWLAATGLGFGLLALTHALTIWLFVPALAFSLFWFKKRLTTAVILLGVFLAVYSPWLIRNYQICGNPGGLALYSVLDGLGHSEAGHMRRLELDTTASPELLLHKMRTNLVTQLNRIFEYLGGSVVALVALLSLLHVFKRPLNAALRWLLLAMWLGGVLGMALFGLNEEQGFAANQLHLLFMPLFTCYGLAFLITQWNQRLGLAFVLPRWSRQMHALLRNLSVGLLFLLCGLPLLFTFISRSWVAPVRWPPYFPIYVATFRDLMKPDEIIASDMPWAIAWYADRPALWLPMTIRNFTDLNDYNVLGLPINGLYLTPISGSMNTMGDIYEGEYKGWGRLVLHSWDQNTFPLHSATLLGFKECLFLSDHDRRPGH